MERLTKQRKYIIEAVSNLGHATLNMVSTYLSENNLKMSLATIYRNLTSLTDDNILRKVDASLDDTYYELVSYKALHDHFICKKCGRIIDVDKVTYSKKSHFKDKSENEVDNMSINYYGTCKDCLNSNNKINKG